MQTSNISNKPASIALNYHERMERINQEWYEHLEKQYLMLDEEIRFFEAALSSLSGYLPEFMTDMVINGCTWDYLCEHYHISRTMVAKKMCIRDRVESILLKIGGWEPIQGLKSGKTRFPLYGPQKTFVRCKEQPD